MGAGLFRVSGGGGEPEVLTTLDTEQGEAHHLWPFIVPGRETVVFVISSTNNPRSDGQLAVLDLDTREITPLGLAGVSPRYVSTGHLVYAAEDGSLRAVPFDATSLEVTGNPVPLVEGVMVKATGAANFSISDNGRLVYVLGGGDGGDQRSLVWVDRQGNEEPLAAEPLPYESPRVSPDGRYVALQVGSGGNDDVLVYDLERDTPSRVTFDPGADGFPIWTPNGQRLVFGSDRDGVRNLYSKAADGTGQAERLTTSENAQFPSSWSADGETLVLMELTEGNVRIGTLPLDDPSGTERLLESTGTYDAYPEVSPDGRWIAYHSNESGQFEVYVRPFPTWTRVAGRSHLPADSRPCGGPTGESCTTEAWAAR